MVKIHFQVEGYGKDEATAFQALSEGVRPVEPDHLWGAVHFFNDDSLDVVIKEDLLNLVQSLFVDVPLQLEQKGQAKLHFSHWAGEFFFATDITGLNVRITGPAKGSTKISGTFSKDELLLQLSECKKRLSTFIQETSKIERASFLQQDC